MIQHFRVARHTSDIEKIKEFYIDLLGFKEIGSFPEHNGYRGVMLGFDNHTWHLEFTASDEEPKRIADPDDVLVLYYETEELYNIMENKLTKSGVPSVKSKNPYWDKYGKTFLDSDGSRVVLCKKQW